METSSWKNREVLAEQFACQRRYYNRLLLGIAVGIAISGVIFWLYTGSIVNLYGSIFFAIFPLLWLAYLHFCLLNPRRDPFETQQRLIKLAEKQRKDIRSINFSNGIMFIITSPFFFVGGIASGGAEYGVVGAILGGLFGLMWFAIGLSSVLSSRRAT